MTYSRLSRDTRSIGKFPWGAFASWGFFFNFNKVIMERKVLELERHKSVVETKTIFGYKYYIKTSTSKLLLTKSKNQLPKPTGITQFTYPQLINTYYETEKRTV